MYDQEPLLDLAIITYRMKIRWAEKKELYKIVDQLSIGAMIGCWLSSRSFPVWCHSELRSDEITDLERNFFVPCYYWYHAFIARDWYRYWHLHRELAPRDKSDAPYRFLLYARDDSGTRRYRKQMLERLKVHHHAILHNWEGTTVVDPTYSAKIDIADAGRSGIHLVAETLFDTNKIHLTEKVFKSMVMSQPFIIWGPPGTLGYLRDYGFQTFDHVWSESYDLEKDPAKRMEMLLELVDKINALPIKQYRRLYQRCLPTIEHNRKRFYSTEFMDQCWSELQSNWHHATDTRNELLQRFSGGHFAQVLQHNPDVCKLDAFKQQADPLGDLTY